jgi:D-alanyl-D-alanine carboxypeptidase
MQVMHFARQLLSCLAIAAFLLVNIGQGGALAATTNPPAAAGKKASVVTKKATNVKQSKKEKAKAAGKLSNKMSKKPAARKKTASVRRAAPVSSASGEKFAALVVDASTGRVLYEKNAGSMRYPASLTKMMTLYLTFDALKRGTISINDAMPVSEKAASQPQTNISLNAGDRLPVKTAIESLVVRSANDSSMVLAEYLGGTQWNFALMMTQKARELGMTGTVFRNPNGLPDDQQYTTAYDMAKLGIALRRDFPEYYPYFKIEKFSYNGITYPTHNRVMKRYDGADGIKTGYIRASGFNLVTSVKRDGYNIVGVIMGGASSSARDDAMIDMLDRTFAQLESGKKNVAHLKGADEQVSVSQKQASAADSLSLISAAYAH